MDDQAAVKAPLPVRVPGAALRELLRIEAVKSRPVHSPGAGVVVPPPNYACTYGRCLAPVVLSPTNRALPFPQSLMQATVLSDWSRHLSNEVHPAGQSFEGLSSIPVPQEVRTPVTTAEVRGSLGPAIPRALDRLRDKPLERQLHALADPPGESPWDWEVTDRNLGDMSDTGVRDFPVTGAARAAWAVAVLRSVLRW